jgi:hypothetical protein
VKRTCTIAKTDGVREFEAEILRIANPPQEIHPGRIFDEGAADQSDGFHSGFEFPDCY